MAEQSAATMAGDGLRAAVWSALGTVRDPELDEPVTDLGFVSELILDDAGSALVRLRLPTYFCAPNFAYLMVADSYDAVQSVPGVERAQVRLDDHFAAEAINAGVATEHGFAETFAGLADGELEELRQTFLRKAHLAAQERVCRQLLRAGAVQEVDRLASLRIGDVPGSLELDRLRRRRRELGLADGPDEALLADGHGRAVDVDQVSMHLHLARTTKVSIDSNATFCRGVLRARYGEQATGYSGQTEAHGPHGPDERAESQPEGGRNSR